jgi:hypothetical protein
LNVIVDPWKLLSPARALFTPDAGSQLDPPKSSAQVKLNVPVREVDASTLMVATVPFAEPVRASAFLHRGPAGLLIAIGLAATASPA